MMLRVKRGLGHKEYDDRGILSLLSLLIFETSFGRRDSISWSHTRYQEHLISHLISHLAGQPDSQPPFHRSDEVRE